MKADFEVTVVGGGCAGLVAAIQAARAGARTLLVEKSALLGGTMTSGGVNAPGLFAAPGRQVIAGIGWELVRAALREAGRPEPAAGGPEAGRHIGVDVALFCALADEAVLQAGADVLFHAMPAEVDLANKGWRLMLCTKTGLRLVLTRVLVDCTGDANVVQLAGLPVERHQPLQPGTLVFRVSGYDFAALDVEAIEGAFEAAVREGRMKRTDFGWGGKPVRGFLKRGGGNANHVCGVDGASSEARTQAEFAGRQVMLRIYRFLRAQKGLEALRIDSMAPEIGIRETVTIRGEAKVTGADYTSGRLWDDAVCYSFYPIDIHTDEGNGIIGGPLPAGSLPTIPRGAMIPAGSRNLLVAGRCVAGDREAHSAYRVEASCMAMGQAAGAMAALSARQGVDPRDLDLVEVRALLRQHGAIVPGDAPA